jgi:hypothetical protein
VEGESYIGAAQRSGQIRQKKKESGRILNRFKIDTWNKRTRKIYQATRIVDQFEDWYEASGACDYTSIAEVGRRKAFMGNCSMSGTCWGVGSCEKWLMSGKTLFSQKAQGSSRYYKIIIA